MFVGCSHPGIVFMARKATEMYGKLKLIVGGFHLFHLEEDEILEIAIEMRKYTKKIAPCHCTGGIGRKTFERVFKEKYMEAKAGSVIEI